MNRDVFVKKTKKVDPGFNICTVLGRKETKGSVGLEIEVEGNKFPKTPEYEGTHNPVSLPGSKYWSYVHDGSLRGKDNAEYVLSKPVEFNEVPAAVEEIFSRMKEYGSVLDESNRTSVHVHLNCQKFHFNRLTSFLALYFTMEEVLTEWCGDHRVGNLFCLRGKDAPALVSQVRRFIESDGKSPLGDHLHYGGLNASALCKFGSLEIRSLRGATDPKVITDWVSILERLYTLSGEMTDPRDIPALFSMSGPLSFFETVLGDKAPLVRSGISFDLDKISESMYEGIRLAQDLCYCRDWDLFKAIDIEADPFGRAAKKIANKLAAQATGNEASYDVGVNSIPMAAPAPLFVGAQQTYADILSQNIAPPQPAVDYWQDPEEF